METENRSWLLFVAGNGEMWVQIVTKRRGTVRDRDFARFVGAHPEGWIAFVEPKDEAGPTESTTLVEVDGTSYVVSMTPVATYLAGNRIPGIVMLQSDDQT